MIYEQFKSKPLGSCILDVFSPFPHYGDRKAWENLPQEIKSHYCDGAKKLKNKQWESLPAVRYMDFYRDGNRSRYQDMVFPRRQDLFILMMAECIEGKGDYIDDIINVVWLICEESTWVIPAHNWYPDGKNRELVDIEAPIVVDLFSAETGSVLSWVYYFLGDAIADAAPLVKRRIEIEMEKRILTPYLERSDFGWMGLNHDQPVNNWNPWINSNVLVAYLIFGDKETKIKGVEKTIKSTDRFMAFYAEDGGCDEGPGYFGVAGASLLDFLETLYAATGDAVNLHDMEMVKNMARYIYRVYIGQSYYVNFADAHAQVSTAAGLLYRTGLKIGDENLCGFANYLMENDYVIKQYSNNLWCLFRLLSNIFQTYEQTYEFSPPKSYWFEGIQVLSARDKEGSLGGMFISAKGGNNDESHNHNDIGNFILYNDSQPVIIDAGVEVYSKATFGPNRYDIWTMQSCYHNTPTINGYDQLPGLDKKANNVSCTLEDGTTVLQMDIKEAYPTEAKIARYNRTFTFSHNGTFEVRDNYLLESCSKPLALNLLAFKEPSIEKGRVIFSETVAMTFNEAEFDAAYERIEMPDENLQKDWKKDHIYRLILTQKNPKTEGEAVLKFEKI